MCGVVVEEYMVYVSSIKAQDLVVNKVFDDGFLNVL